MPKSSSELRDLDVALGRQISIYRRLAGLSQTELGAAIGVSFQQVQKYEKGTNRLSANRLPSIASALGVSINELFEFLETVHRGRPNADQFSLKPIRAHTSPSAATGGTLE